MSLLSGAEGILGGKFAIIASFMLEQVACHLFCKLYTIVSFRFQGIAVPRISHGDEGFIPPKQ